MAHDLQNRHGDMDVQMWGLVTDMRHEFLNDSDMGHAYFLNSTAGHEDFLTIDMRHYTEPRQGPLSTLL